MTTVEARRGKEYVEELAAAAHSTGKVFSRSKQVEFCLLLRRTTTRLAGLLREAPESLQELTGEIVVRPGKSLATRTVFVAVTNLVVSHVEAVFRYFAQQLERADNNLDVVRKLQPEQVKKVSEVVDLLQAVMDLNQKHPRLLHAEHVEALLRVVRSVIHRVPAFAEQLGLRERDVALGLRIQ